MKILSLDEKIELANLFGIEPNVLLAVMAVESSGSGYDKVTQQIKVQFEPYWFNIYTGIRIPNGVEGQMKEWEAFHYAESKNSDAAYMSTSWGLGQIMGFNHESAGYSSAKAMADAFKESEYNQLKGMLSHIKSKKKMYAALIQKDWPTFAYYYNGKEYRKFDYDNRLNEAYHKLK